MANAVARDVFFQPINCQDNVLSRIQDNIQKAFSAVGLTLADYVKASDIVIANPTPSNLAITATAAANTAVTATLPAVPGKFHYITSIVLARAATAALAGTATLVHTSTNLPGSLAWTVGNAMAAGGTQVDLSLAPATPIKASAAGTATTITMPAPGAAVINRIVVTYYTA